MAHAAAARSGILPPGGLRDAARRFVEEKGSVQRAAKHLGIGRGALATLIAGLPVRRGTIVLVSVALRWPGAEKEEAAGSSSTPPEAPGAA